MSKYQLMRPLTPTEYESLKNSIRESGINAPIILDEEGSVIDGHHRQRIYNELQAEGVSLPILPKIVKVGLTEDQKVNLAYELNITGRQLSAEEVAQMRSQAGRKKAAEQSLKQSPQMADNWHAQQLGISKNTVSDVRNKLEAACQIDKLNKLTGADGKSYPRQVERKPISIYNPSEPEIYSVKKFFETAPPESVQAVAEGKSDVRMAAFVNQKAQEKALAEADPEYKHQSLQRSYERMYSTVFDRVMSFGSDYDEVALCLLENRNRTPENISEQISSMIQKLTALKAAVRRSNKLRAVK